MRENKKLSSWLFNYELKQPSILLLNLSNLSPLMNSEVSSSLKTNKSKVVNAGLLAVCSSETLVSTYKSTCHYIIKDQHHHLHLCEDLEFHK